MSPSHAPAGWYDDGSGQQRWWDGEAWGPFAPSVAGTENTDANAATHGYPLDEGHAPAQDELPAFPPQPFGELAQREQKPSRGKKIGAAIAGLAIVVGGFAAVKAGSSNTAAPTPAATPTAEAPVVPAPTEPTQDATPKSSPEEPQDSAADVLKQTVTFEAMDAMDIEQFAALDYADRVGYAYGLLKSQQGDEGLGQIFSNDESPFEPTLTAPSFWSIAMDWSVGQSNLAQGAKLVSVGVYYTHKKYGGPTKNYRNLSSAISNLKITEGSLVETIFYDVKQFGKTQQGLDEDGNPITFTNISYEPLSSDTGKAVRALETAQVIHAKTQLLDGTIVSTYPAGLKADSVASPDKDYPY